MKDAERNKYYLLALQAQANDRLKSRGHLFLNEVYEMLGFRLTKAGAVVGWIYDPREPMGDNFVDFGMFEVCREKAVDFVNGYERSFYPGLQRGRRHHRRAGHPPDAVRAEP